MNINRRTQPDLTTEPPLLGRCCYAVVLSFFIWVYKFNHIVNYSCTVHWNIASILVSQTNVKHWSFKFHCILSFYVRTNKYFVVFFVKVKIIVVLVSSIKLKLSERKIVFIVVLGFNSLTQQNDY